MTFRRDSGGRVWVEPAFDATALFSYELLTEGRADAFYAPARSALRLDGDLVTIVAANGVGRYHLVAYDAPAALYTGRLLQPERGHA